MDGFTIKCNKCGKEIVIGTETEDKATIHVERYGYDDETIVWCECGNETIE